MSGLREPISDKLRENIKGFVREYGVDVLANSAGVTPQTIYRWSNGKISSADGKTLSKVEQTLRKPGDAIPDMSRQDHEVRPATMGTLTSVPMLGTAQAAGVDELITSDDWLNAMQSADTIQLADAPPGTVCLEVDGESMLPEYPHGTKLFCLPNKLPERGDTVACMLASGQLVTKVYHRKDNIVTLSSVNPEGQTFSWNVKEGPGCYWMWPVIYAMVDLRKQRWYRSQMQG